jgi:hypothetical protein
MLCLVDLIDYICVFRYYIRLSVIEIGYGIIMFLPLSVNWDLICSGLRAAAKSLCKL